MAAIALIRREVDGQTLWLAQWNEGWQAYALVGGHKDGDETFRQCVMREVEEELGLRREADFDVATEPAAQLAYTALSHRALKQTAYTMELFKVELRSQETVREIDANPVNRWLSEEEIRASRCADGQPISETVALLFEKAGLWAEKHDAE